MSCGLQVAECCSRSNYLTFDFCWRASLLWEFHCLGKGDGFLLCCTAFSKNVSISGKLADLPLPFCCSVSSLLFFVLWLFLFMFGDEAFKHSIAIQLWMNCAVPFLAFSLSLVFYVPLSSWFLVVSFSFRFCWASQHTDWDFALFLVFVTESTVVTFKVNLHPLWLVVNTIHVAVEGSWTCKVSSLLFKLPLSIVFGLVLPVL